MFEACHDLGRREGVSAEYEEVAIDSDGTRLENVFPDACDQAFDVISRKAIAGVV